MEAIAEKTPRIDSLLENVELFASRVITDEFSDKLVFHDLKFVHGVIRSIEEIGVAEGLSDDDLKLVLAAGWFQFLGFKDLKKFSKKIDNPRALFVECFQNSVSITQQFFTDNQIEEDIAQKVIGLLHLGMEMISDDSHLPCKVLSDATAAYLGRPKSRKQIELLYEEFLLLDAVKGTRAGFYEHAINYLKEHKYYTKYARETFTEKKQALISKMEKSKKALDQNADDALKKELDISDAEFKKLKKEMGSLKGRDSRGVQTMFRTTSRNHYTLNQMVDRKANIMISINAIIISVIVGRIVGHEVLICIHNSPYLVLLLLSTLSIFFGVMAIRPDDTHGEFTEEEIRNKKGNLLFFGNYHNMKQRDYEWGMMQMLNDGDYLYSTMIRDQYFMGQILAKKYKYIRKSLTLFIVGFIIAVVTFLIVGMLGEQVHI